MTQVKPGDKITTTVRLSQDSDVKFSVRRGLPIILQTRPGIFVYPDEYEVKPTDGLIQYTWLARSLNE